MDRRLGLRHQRTRARPSARGGHAPGPRDDRRSRCRGEIESVTTWQINQAWATRYSSGRGCSAVATRCTGTRHRAGSGRIRPSRMPSTWRGSLRTSSRDGRACRFLTPTPTSVRRSGRRWLPAPTSPVSTHGPINEAFRTVGEADPVAAGLAKLTDPSPAGVAAREALVKAVELKNTRVQRAGHGAEPALWNPAASARSRRQRGDLGTRQGPLPAGHDASRRQAAARTAGVQRGRQDLDPGRHRPGETFLLTGLACCAWTAAAGKWQLPYLRTVVVGTEGSEDAYHDWHRAREIEEAGALLVRPDGYVAWRHAGFGTGYVEEAVYLLQAAIAAVLSNDA